MFIVSAALVGLLIGSFLNVVIYRLPIMLERDWRAQCRELGESAGAHAAQPPAPEAPFNLFRPRSACPSCKEPVRALHNVPILSWLWLRARCAHCGARISVRYPIVEAVTGIVSAIVAWRFGYGVECAGALLLAWGLIALAAIDLDHQLLPDVITLPFLWLGVGFALLGEHGARYEALAGLEASVLGAIIGYLSLWLFYHLFRLVTGKEGMGYGDFKLLAMLGAWLGWNSLPLIILLAAMCGAVIGVLLIVIRGRDRNIPIPFGPFLAGAGFLALLWGHEIVAAYRSASGL
jgi:leader peptidase (prepilin peptidase)/N-methyltransferase